MKKARNRFINNLPYLFLVGVIAFGLMTIVGTGGGGGGGSRTIIQLNVVMGPIVGANVFVYPLDNRNLEIASGITEDSEDINEAGHVSLEIPPEYSETPLLLRVIGGVDIDTDDDGVRDAEPTDNDITLEVAVPTAAELEGMRVVANPLLLYASGYVLSNFQGESNIPEGYEPATDPEAVRNVLRRVAKALLKEDIDGDGTIDWQDIVSFHPLTDKDKSRIPWDYVLDEIERSRQEYYSSLTLWYARSFHRDPGTLAPFDWDGDGDWKDDLRDEHESSFTLQFYTNKNGYTVQDLLDGQGNRGGSVTFPEGSTVSYFWGYPCNGDYGISGSEEDVNEVPLDIRCNPNTEGNLNAQVGGNITSPQCAPVGEYVINYRTGDDNEHQEKLYVFENSAESFFYAIPEIEVDDEGFIEKLNLRFEDKDGYILEDPPILAAWLHFQLWATVDKVNEIVREEGYYTGVFGQPDNIDEFVYRGFVSLVTPTAPLYPTNNSHKIYYEDLIGITLCFIGGDGVFRAYAFDHNTSELYPQLEEWYFDGEKVTVKFTPSTETGRDVVSIRYKFDSGEWMEEAGATLTLAVPGGASKFYVTAKDTAGFYRYPPHELNL